jgi:hypothetical protein
VQVIDFVSGRLHAVVTARTNARPVAIARLIVGCAALLKAWPMFGLVVAVLAGDGLRVPHAAWMPQLSVGFGHAGIAAWVAAALAFTAGMRTRAAGAALAASIAFVMLLDQQLYSNHTYLLILVVGLLTLSDNGAALSVDAGRHGERRRIPAWPVVLLKMQLTIVYGFAAVAKVNVYYLSGSVLNAFWNRTGPFALPDALRRVEVLMPLALATVLVEMALAIGLWQARLRPMLFMIGFGMHVVIVVTMGPAVELTVFALTMFSMYVLFLDEPPAYAVGKSVTPPRSAAGAA